MKITNMYKDVETWNPLSGACGYNCDYCYVKSMKKRFKHTKNKYTGKPWLVKKELKKKFKPNTTVFVCSCTDLFHPYVPDLAIKKIIERTIDFPETDFIFQSKSPYQIDQYIHSFKKNNILGTTIETDRQELIKSTAPDVKTRLENMLLLKYHAESLGFKTFITIEPIMDLLHWGGFACRIKTINPDWVWVGADSKNNNLIEPSKKKTQSFIRLLKDWGVTVRLKKNLKRIVGKDFFKKYKENE